MVDEETEKGGPEFGKEGFSSPRTGTGAEDSGARRGGAGAWLMDLLRQQTRSLLTQQKSRAAGELERLAGILRQAARDSQPDDQGALGKLAGQAAQKMEHASRYFHEKNLEDLAEDAGRLVRGNPVLVMSGALAAGFILARFLKSSAVERRNGKREIE